MMKSQARFKGMQVTEFFSVYVFGASLISYVPYLNLAML